MATLQDIKRRIVSVKNTQKITRAMKLVATAKFARANGAVVAARPYSRAFDGMLKRLVAAAGEDLESPLLRTEEEKKSLIVVVATDRGFCGSLNANQFKFVMRQMKAKKDESGVDCDLLAWGRRAGLFCKRLPHKHKGTTEKVLEAPTYEQAKKLAKELIEKFESGDYQRVYICYNEFKSALAQVPTLVPVLPIGLDGGKASEEAAAEASSIIAEPDLKSLAASIIEKGVASLIFRLLLEAAASEHGARMTAMDSATNNADDVIKSLTIEYNRARQAAITTELIEITSGAEAL